LTIGFFRHILRKIREKPRAGLDLATFSDPENRTTTDFLTYIKLRDIIRGTITSISKYIGSNTLKISTNTHISRILGMLSKYYPINNAQSFENFFALLLGHKNIALLFPKPMVVIQYYHELITELFCFLEKANMARMEWIKTTTHSDNDRLGGHRKRVREYK
jgi:hypothetical protein